MSEKIDEVLIDHICDVAPAYPLERVHFMFDKFPDKDVYLECKGINPYILVRLDEDSYSFFGPAKDSIWYKRSPISEDGWQKCLKRSYKIVRDTGVIPYAYRS